MIKCNNITIITALIKNLHRIRRKVPEGTDIPCTNRNFEQNSPESTGIPCTSGNFAQDSQEDVCNNKKSSFATALLDIIVLWVRV